MSVNHCKQDQDLAFAARHTVIHVDGRYRFQFLCALCDSGYATEFIRAESLEAALAIAEKKARPFFNGCFSCGKWVCDYHYNMQATLCTDCAPLEADSAQMAYLRERDETHKGS